MASLIPNVLLPKDPHIQIYLAGISLTLLIVVVFAITLGTSKGRDEEPSGFQSYLKFFYASFLKPHTGDGTGNGQQDALESFYKAQAGVYDATRKRLLRGREDMLGLVAAQLKQKANGQDTRDEKRIWVDVSLKLPFPCRANDFTDRWRNRLEYRIDVRIRLGPGILLQRLPRRLLTFTLRGGSQTFRKIGMDECQGHLSRCENFPSRGS